MAYGSLPAISAVVMEIDGHEIIPYAPSASGYTDRMAWDEARLHAVSAIVRASLKRGDILDIGASPYFLTADLASRGFHLVANGVPVEDHGTTGTLRIETERGAANAELALYDAEGPFPHDDESFDAVIAGEIFEHFYREPWVFLSESWRVLRPGGLLVITTPNGHSIEHLVNWLKQGPTGMGFNPHWPSTRHAREYSLGELRELVDSQGFAVTEARTANFSLHSRSEYTGPLGGVKFGAYRLAKRLSVRRRGLLANRGASVVLCARKESGRAPGPPPDFMLYGAAFVREGKTFADDDRGA